MRLISLIKGFLFFSFNIVLVCGNHKNHFQLQKGTSEVLQTWLRAHTSPVQGSQQMQLVPAVDRVARPLLPAVAQQVWQVRLLLVVQEVWQRARLLVAVQAWRARPLLVVQHVWHGIQSPPEHQAWPKALVTAAVSHFQPINKSEPAALRAL